MAPEGGSNLYNVKILRSFVLYCKEHLQWDESKLDQLFRSCEADLSFIDSDDNWFSQDFSDLFYRRLVEMTGDKDIAYKVGKFSTTEGAKGIGGRIAQSFLSPRLLLKNIQQIAGYYTKGSRYELVEVARENAVLRSVISTDCAEKPYQCLNRMGMLGAIPTFFGLPAANVIHDVCFHEGGPYCEYRLQWREPMRSRVHTWGLVLSLFASIGMLACGFSILATGLVTSVVLMVTRFVSSEIQSRLTRDALNQQNVALEESIRTLERRRGEAFVVRDIMKATTRLMPLEELCQRTADLLVQKMGYDRSLLLLVDNERNVLRAEAFSGFSSDTATFINGAEFTIREDNDSGFLIKVVNTKSPILVRNVTKQLEQLSPRSQKLVKLLGIEALVAVPILYDGVVLGVMTIDSQSPEKALGASDLELLLGVSDHLAVTISNLKSFQATERSLQKTKALEEKERGLRTIFQKYVPTEIFDGQSVVGLERYLAKKLLSVMFIDIVGFTSMSELKSPEEIAEILGVYIEAVNETARKYNGHVNKIIGDGLLLYFDPKLRNCLSAGVEILENVKIINSKLSEKGFDPISIGIGCHQGECILGNIGYKERLDYTVIGDTVNTASRIESHTRKVGPNSLCFSGALLHEATGLEFLPQGSIALKGRKEPVETFSLQCAGVEVLRRVA